MRKGTIAVHGGYEPDPATSAVAVPIYQILAFDSAEPGAALFTLEPPGFRYSRIGSPANAVLERHVADLKDGVDAGRFAWADHGERFPWFNKPDASYGVGRSLRGRGRAVDQMAAQLADVLEHGAAAFHDVVPNRDAESPGRISTDPPWTSIAPTATTPPVL